MNASCLQGILTLLLSAWALMERISLTHSSVIANNHDNSTLPITVGDSLCPHPAASALCDPDNLLSDDDAANIEALLLESYQNSWLACHNEEVQVEIGVFIQRNSRPDNKEEVDALRFQWGIGQGTPCGQYGVLFYLTVNDEGQAHVYLSTGPMRPTLSSRVLQSVVDGMKPFLRHDLYGEAIQAGILELTAFVKGDKHVPNLQDECLKDFYLSSWCIIFFLYCCGGRILVLFLRTWGRRALELDTRARRCRLRQEVDEKLKEIEEHYKHKYPHHEGDYMAQCCPICFEDFPSSSPGEEAKEDTPLVFQKNQLGSDGKEITSLPCGHVFDHTCVVNWMVTLRTKNPDCRLSCPVCMESF